ncbi:DUF4845 domain-containing protein [uncultured Aquitalea sp.]|uniref:DUF4845 domain-containing protein n=1 Tax=uncultured Aquitalea sp. TaxID=540272 RepID=UPI0025F8C143|nr:DUF4845 domain-containing protein [uncultured Aquitalea sp.]
MKHKQGGLTAISVIVLVAIFGMILLLAGKVIPVYNEYSQVRRLITKLAETGGQSEADIRKNFSLQSSVADISSIKADNLVVVINGSAAYIRATYRREVPLFANVGLVFDFDTQAGQTPQ